VNNSTKATQSVAPQEAKKGFAQVAWASSKRGFCVYDQPDVAAGVWGQSPHYKGAEP